MTDTQIRTAHEINHASFVVVAGQAFHVLTGVDHDGYFFASDSYGEEIEFNVNNVDHVEVL